MKEERRMDWKILSSEYLYKETWFTIRKDRCEAPDGKIIDPYYVYEFPTWVSALAITMSNEAVLVRQYRHGIQETMLEIPGGCVDKEDESLQHAIERELLEETGYKFSEYHYLGKISPNPSTNNNWLHMYLATGGIKTDDLNLDHNEDIEVQVVSLGELKQMLREHKLVQALHVTTIMYALEKLGELKY